MKKLLTSPEASQVWFRHQLVGMESKMGSATEVAPNIWIVTVASVYPEFPSRRVEMHYAAGAENIEDALKAVGHRLGTPSVGGALSFSAASVPAAVARTKLKLGEVCPYNPR